MDEPKQEQSKPVNNRKRKTAAAVVFGVIAIIGLISILLYIRYKNAHISTDDAYIDGDVHSVAPRVAGTVKAIYVKSNQFVKAGELLVELDPVDYDVKVKEADSSLATEKARLREIALRIEVARRQLKEAEAKAEAVRALGELQHANLDLARKDKERAENLIKKDAISKEKYDKAMTAYATATAQVKASAEGLKSVLATVETQKAVIRQAEAARATQMANIGEKEAVLEGADLSAGYTKIVAPVDGYVTKKSVEIGNQVQAGQPLMAVVPLNGLYVTANYKETQLEKVKTGQVVDIDVDTYPGKTFKGKVESIMAGTGSAFSLFPAENATGNYVKVVQRIPIKIVFDTDTDPKHVLRLGMSVVPTIVVGD